MQYLKVLFVTTILSITSLYAFADLQEGINAFEKKQYLTAFKNLKSLAENGNAEAQFIIGQMYFMSQPDFERDMGKAIHWFTQASNLGKYEAMDMLGVLLRYGVFDAPKDPEWAAYWQKKAFIKKKLQSENGDIQALADAGRDLFDGTGVAKNETEGFAWIEEAARQNNITALLWLGKYYSTGANKDLVKSFSWYKKAAEQGDKFAQVKLGSRYENGIGTAKNGERVIYWYTQAHKNGHLEISKKIADLYSKGIVIDKDEKLASKWYLVSANSGHKDSMYELYKRYRKGLGIEKNNEIAIRWLKEAANRGYTPAQTTLANATLNGEGVTADYERALDLYFKALKKKSKTAVLDISDMHYKGLLQVKDYNRAIDLLREAKFESFASSIEDSLKCNESSATVLFGTAIKCVDRRQFRNFVKNAGGIPVRVDYKYFGDLYSSENLLTGSSELLISYSPQNRNVALIQYTLPSRLDAEQVTRVTHLLSSKYGKPESVSGRASVGEVTYRWTLADEIELWVLRDWPDTTTYIQYRYPEAYNAQQEEIKRIKAGLEALKTQEQSGNF